MNRDQAPFVQLDVPAVALLLVSGLVVASVGTTIRAFATEPPTYAIPFAPLMAAN